MSNTRPLNLQKILNQCFVDKKLDPRTIRAFELGYCNDSAVLGTIKSWVSQYDGSRKSTFTSAEKEWIDKLTARIARFEGSVRINQNIINAKLEVFSKKYLGVDLNFHNDKIKDFSAGCCSGLATLVSYAFILNFKPRRVDQHNVSIIRDDWRWLRALLINLVQWDEKSVLNADEIKDIRLLLNYLEYFQNIAEYQNLHQGDNDYGIVDTRDRQFKRIYSIGATFTEAETEEVLTTISIKNTKQKAVSVVSETKDSVAVQAEPFSQFSLLTSHNHDTSIIEIGNLTFFYDANNLTGPIDVPKADDLAFLVFLANEFDSQKPSPLGVRVFSENRLAHAFPEVSTTLNKLHIMKNPPFTNQGKLYCVNMNALDVATYIGCINSVEFFLQQGFRYQFASSRAELLKQFLHYKPFSYGKFKYLVGIAQKALQFNDLDLLKRVAAEDKKILDHRLLDNENSLSFAVDKGFVEIADFLLDNGAKLSELNAKREDVLEVMLEKNNPKMLDLLKNRMNNPEIYKLVNTRFLSACRDGKWQRIQELLALKPDINIANEITGRTALHCAAARNNLDLVRQLVAYGADVSLRNQHGLKAVDLAVNHAVRTLLFKKERELLNEVKSKVNLNYKISSLLKTNGLLKKSQQQQSVILVQTSIVTRLV